MTITIWRFTDGKPGHDSQSIGLCNAIEKLKGCQRFDIPTESFLSYLNNFLFRRFPSGNHLPDPDIIIGAGHATHLAMLCAKHARKGKVIVLMKPSLPLSLFDVCIIPKHDGVNEKNNVITTMGALNPINFKNKEKNDLGLILLGGPSTHYAWDSKNILHQIKEIITHDKTIQWKIADSPRTPKQTLAMMDKKNHDNIDILNYQQTDTSEIRKLITKAGVIWVSSDSISMIYEALSSGADVGLLYVKQKNENRLSQSIMELVAQNHLTVFVDWKKTALLKANTLKLAEADRCASLLIEKGLLS